MGFGFRVLGLRFRVHIGFKVLGFRALETGCWRLEFRFVVEGLRGGLGSRVYGLRILELWACGLGI